MRTRQPPRLPAGSAFAREPVTPPDRPASGRATVGDDSRVIKKLAPDQRGALAWAAHYGSALVCVRYREDAAAQRRFTTVELVVEERAAPKPATPPPAALHAFAPVSQLLVGVRIGFNETALRERVRSAGARWDAQARLWRMPRTLMQHLGLQERVTVDE